MSVLTVTSTGLQVAATILASGKAATDDDVEKVSKGNRVILGITHTFEALAFHASFGTIKPENKVAISRFYNLTSVAAVAGDFAVQFAHDHGAAHLSGLLSFTVLGTRTALNLLHDFKQNARRVLAVGSAIAATVASIGGPLVILHHYDPVALLSMGGIWIGSMADYFDNQMMRRRCFLAMGLSTSSFGVLTQAWGLVGKNLIADAGTSLVFMIYNKDPLLMRPVKAITNFLPLRFNRH